MAWEFDPYSILGVPASAQSEDIKSAYRRIARRLHPDANPTNPGAAVQFSDVTAAYELLLDPIRRKMYDEQSAALAFVPPPVLLKISRCVL